MDSVDEASDIYCSYPELVPTTGKSITVVKGKAIIAVDADELSSILSDLRWYKDRWS